MWRRLGKIVSTISGIAGVVGWITLPDDAAQWPEKLRPLIMAVDRDTIVIGLLAASGAGFAWAIFGPVVAEWYRRRRAVPLLIEFSDSANDRFGLRFSPSSYRASCTMGVPGEGGEGVRTDGAISRECYGFGIRNPPGSKTAKGVRAELTHWTFGPIVAPVPPVSLPPADQASAASVDIQPGAARLFRLVEFLSPEWGGMFSAIEIVEPERLEELRFIASEGVVSSPSLGAAVPTLTNGRGINLPTRKAEVHLDVTVYADDLPPTRARFALRRSERITVHLIAQGLSLPRKRGFGNRGLAGIGRRTWPRTRPG